MEPLIDPEEAGDVTLLIDPEEAGDVTWLIEPELDGALLIEPSFVLLEGVGATTATGVVGAGSTVPGPVGDETGDVAGAGTIPEQQSRIIPSVVGQHSPVNPNEAQTG